jgi:segregation and condensation protein A
VDSESWGDAKVELPVRSMPVLHLDGFDGPMDLLLDLAERQLIDLGKMSILELAEQFAAVMERMTDLVALERRADWLVLATRLVVLRTRLLFPKSPEEAADAAREADREIQRLDEMARMRAAAHWLSRRPYLGIDVFSRPHPKATHESGYVALMEACLVVLRERPGTEEFRPPDTYRVEVPNFWRIPDAIDRVRTLLTEKPEGGPLAGFVPSIGKDEASRTLKLRTAIASTFAASLELSRQQFLEADQDEHFGEVTIHATWSPHRVREETRACQILPKSISCDSCPR